MASILFVACRKEQNDDAGGTNTAAMAGEWWVQIKVNNALVAPDYFKVFTYNTAENIGTKMWIDDQENIWPFKLQMDVDPAAKSFSAPNATSEYTNITVKLANGKMLDKVTKGPVSNAVTDSIYFEAEFSDDPGTTTSLQGIREQDGLKTTIKYYKRTPGISVFQILLQLIPGSLKSVAVIEFFSCDSRVVSTTRFFSFLESFFGLICLFLLPAFDKGFSRNRGMDRLVVNRRGSSGG